MKAAKENWSPVCEMAFFAVTDGSRVDVRLWAPQYDPATGRFHCKVAVEGLPDAGSENISSDDQFGALGLAMKYLSIIFARAPVEYRTKWGDMPHMYFPKEIPWDYGTDVYNRLCAMVNAEVQKIEDDLTRRRQADPDRNEGK